MHTEYWWENLLVNRAGNSNIRLRWVVRIDVSNGRLCYRRCWAFGFCYLSIAFLQWL